MEISDHNVTVLDCPHYTKEDYEYLFSVSFWVEGVCQTCMALLGLATNFLSSFILTRKSMRNSFNLLLVSLAGFDAAYLFGAILESFRKSFDLSSNLHVILFPKFLYPLHQASMIGSIFMTVAIAFERYWAVHSPVHYNQVMADKKASKRRLLLFLLPVIFLSLAFSIPKFFEAKVDYDLVPISDNDTTMEKQEWVPNVTITDLRTNPWYSSYNTWSRFFIFGLIPFLLLTFFNYAIYVKIKDRRKKLFQQQDQPTLLASTALDEDCRNPASQTDRSPTEIVQVERNVEETARKPCRKISCSLKRARMMLSNHQKEGRNEEEGEHQRQEVHLLPPPKPSFGQPGRSGGIKKSCSFKEKNKLSPNSNDPIKRLSCSEINLSEIPPSASTTSLPKKVSSPKENKSTKLSICSIKKKRRSEDNLAMVFMGIIIIFLVCHIPRILLSLYELATLSRASQCEKNGMTAFPSWMVATISISHLLLVFNSATNMIVYCILSSKFREEFCKVFDGVCKNWCPKIRRTL